MKCVTERNTSLDVSSRVQEKHFTRTNMRHVEKQFTRSIIKSVRETPH